MCKNVLKIACGAIICTIFFVACGDNKDSSVENKADSAVNSSAKSDLDSAKSVDSADSADSAKSADSADSATPTQSVDSAKSADSVAQSNPNPINLYKKCIACHGARGDKVAPGSVDNITIADLSKETLIADLKGYRAKTLSKGGSATIMYLQANGLSDLDIEILGEYISNFKK